jgi:hypothetical protein
MPGVGWQAARLPGAVAVAGPSPYESLDPDVILTPAFPLVLAQHTRRLQEPPLAGKNHCSEQEWEQMKPVIHRLYIKEGKTLDNVMSTMSLVYHFQAS